MNKIITITLCSVLSFPVFSSESQSVIYQAGVTGATLTGAYEGSTTYEELKSHGNFGLGTSNGIQGEMVLIDHEMFITENGKGETMRPSMKTRTPFAIVTDFNPDTIFNVTKVSSKEKFVELFQQRFNYDNLFQAIRVDGDFKAIQFRSIVKDADNSERNLKKYIEKNQIINDLKDIKGSLVIFRSPKFAYPMTVPGYHIHFISSDRKYAGHVYDFNINSAQVSVQTISTFNINLPTNHEYIMHDVERVDNKVINHVESGIK